MHHKLNYAYVGVDTHKAFHVAVVINFFNEKLGEITFDNKPATFGKMVSDVKKLCKKQGLTPVFGLEDVGGAGRSLAVHLVEKKETVKEVNPALGHAYRLSAPTTKKDDSYDALCVARALKDMLDTLPDANPNDVYWTLKQLVNRRSSVVKANAILQIQLHDHLKFHYPSYKKFFSEIDLPCALAFWEGYPSPHCLEGVSQEELRQFLLKNSHNVLSTKAVAKIKGLIESDGDTKRDLQETRDSIVKGIVKQIKFNNEQLESLESDIKSLLDTLGFKLDTMPGIGTVTAADIIAEIGDINRFPNADKLARFAGIAPVNFSSAGKGTDQKSKQGNRVLNSKLYFLAIQMVQTHAKTKKPRNPVFYEYFKKKISEGKTKPQALTSIARQLVRIIYSMMKHKTEYIMPELPNQEAV